MNMPQSRIENASSLQKMRHKLFFSGGDKFYLVMIDGFIVYKKTVNKSSVPTNHRDFINL